MFIGSDKVLISLFCIRGHAQIHVHICKHYEEKYAPNYFVIKDLKNQIPNV